PEPTETGDAKCVCCCRRMGRAGASNHWWKSRCRCGRSARRCGVRAAAPNGRQRPWIGADDVNPLTTSAFDLPDHLSPKADPALIAGDEQHFAAIAESLQQTIADL